MNQIQKNVRAVHQRQQNQWIWSCLSVGLLAGGALGCLFAIARFFFDLPMETVFVPLAAGPLFGLTYAFACPKKIGEAATTIDRQGNLKDRIATALSFLSGQTDSPLHQLQIEDANQRVADIKPEDIAPVNAPKAWLPGLATIVMALVFAYLSTPATPAVAEIVKSDVVAAQADRVEDSLEELKEFNEEDLDPEVEEMLKELVAKIEELKEPGIDPKEALAKLSEMESVLQQQQQELEAQDIDAELQAIGEAIALAEPMKSAGQALVSGELDKAAKELEKMDMPEMDRKTEKSVKEKLDKLAQNDKMGQGKKSLKKAVQQMSEGIGQGNRSKFDDGRDGLAKACRSQGRRKKLSDLLRKQCQCLGECKGECESECKSSGNSNKKGGNDWGRGASDNQAGDKTSKLGGQSKMQLKGEESASGDVDVETIKSGEEEQEAVRQYREKAGEYEQLSENVLSSEPIPLGHRQTIRKYFELIRPKNNQVDEVKQKLDSEK